MPQLKYGLGFSHQDVNEKIRKVSGNEGDSEPVIRTKTEECLRSQGQVTDARQKFRKFGQTLLKRSNAAQPPPTDASSRDQSSSACGNERPKVKSVSPEPASKSKHSSSSFGKGKKRKCKISSKYEKTLTKLGQFKQFPRPSFSC